MSDIDQERALCPEAYLYGEDFYNCNLREPSADTCCREAMARDFKNCEIWKASQEKAPASGCEVIDLATRRRAMLTSQDGLGSISVAWTKIGKAVAGLYIQWLESPEGQAALAEILGRVLADPEGK